MQLKRRVFIVLEQPAQSWGFKQTLMQELIKSSRMLLGMFDFYFIDKLLVDVAILYLSPWQSSLLCRYGRLSVFNFLIFSVLGAEVHHCYMDGVLRNRSFETNASLWQHGRHQATQASHGQEGQGPVQETLPAPE